MSKRYTDTNKYKKEFIRGLQGAYKLLWDYLYHDCDHAGMWIVDFEVAQIYLGHDMPVNKDDALKYFNEGETRIIEVSKNRWFIVPFIEFQYGELNPANRVHSSVIKVLSSYGLLENENKNKGLVSPLEWAKYKDKDKDMDKDMDKDRKGGAGENQLSLNPENSKTSFDPLNPETNRGWILKHPSTRDILLQQDLALVATRVQQPIEVVMDELEWFARTHARTAMSDGMIIKEFGQYLTNKHLKAHRASTDQLARQQAAEQRMRAKNLPLPTPITV